MQPARIHAWQEHGCWCASMPAHPPRKHDLVISACTVEQRGKYFPPVLQVIYFRVLIRTRAPADNCVTRCALLFGFIVCQLLFECNCFKRQFRQEIFHVLLFTQMHMKIQLHMISKTDMGGCSLCYLMNLYEFLVNLIHVTRCFHKAWGSKWMLIQCQTTLSIHAIQSTKQVNHGIRTPQSRCNRLVARLDWCSCWSKLVSAIICHGIYLFNTVSWSLQTLCL